MGGIGCGSIERSISGDFQRFRINPCDENNKKVAANQFIVFVHDERGDVVNHHVLNSRSPPADDSLAAWQWRFPREYVEHRQLYPRSWTKYVLLDAGVDIRVRQISPIIPHNYKVNSCISGCIL